MTQEEKDLLLKDLCARLPYGVKLHIPSFSDTPQRLQQISDYETVEINDYAIPIDINEVKPYLRPMSSMTEEEDYEWWDFSNEPTVLGEHTKSIDFLNSHHFDYRGLIAKGLALEAKEGMYN